MSPTPASPPRPVPAADPGQDPLAFTPIATRTNRHDGWTPQRQRDFIRRLSEIGIVSAAARAVGMSPKSAYALRHRAGPITASPPPGTLRSAKAAPARSAPRSPAP